MIVRLSLLRKTIINPEYSVFMCLLMALQANFSSCKQV